MIFSLFSPVAGTCVTSWDGDAPLSCWLHETQVSQRGVRDPGISPLLFNGSSQNRPWVPLTLTKDTSEVWCQETQELGPGCAPPRSQSPGSLRGRLVVDSWGGHTFAVMLPPTGRHRQGVSLALSDCTSALPHCWGEFAWALQPPPYAMQQGAGPC